MKYSCNPRLKFSFRLIAAESYQANRDFVRLTKTGKLVGRWHSDNRLVKQNLMNNLTGQFEVCENLRRGGDGERKVEVMPCNNTEFERTLEVSLKARGQAGKMRTGKFALYTRAKRKGKWVGGWTIKDQRNEFLSVKGQMSEDLCRNPFDWVGNFW